MISKTPAVPPNKPAVTPVRPTLNAAATKLTTSEVRIAATTNEDMTRSQYKKLKYGFDEWLVQIKNDAKIAGAAEAAETIKKLNEDLEELNKLRAAEEQRINANKSRRQRPLIPTPATDSEEGAPKKSNRSRNRSKKKKTVIVEENKIL